MEKKDLKNASVEELYQEYLKALYYNNSGYISYEDGEKEKAAEKKIYYTYGEISFEGADKIVKTISPNSDDVILDLGSGVGKFSVQVFLSSPVKKVIGIEAHAKRHTQAKEALKLVKKDLPELFKNNRQINYIQGNFLNFNFDEATHIFTCSTCFSPELMQMIGTKLNHSKKVKTIFSLKKIPNLEIFELKDTLQVKCSWDDKDTLCYFYQRKAQA